MEMSDIERIFKEVVRRRGLREKDCQGSDIEVWESEKKKAWIEKDSIGTRLRFKTKGSNMSQGIGLEDAETVYDAVAYFKKRGKWFLD